MFKEITTYNIVSLEEYFSLSNEKLVQNSYDTPEDQFEKREIKEIIKEIINTLPLKEKQVISLYYYDELTYKEISEILKVSESRISQLHSKAIITIKNRLKLLDIFN